jgi:DNA-binding CsgD family transcriptional regulator
MDNLADAAPALADMVAGLGGGAFADRFLAALRALTGADLCSAFRIGRDGGLRVLFAEGAHPTIPSFAQVASLDYAEHYWKQDGLRRRLKGGPRTVRVVRQASSAIADPGYRAACYDRAGIAERLTLYQGGPEAIFASGYRTREHGPFSDIDVARLETFAPILLSAADRHDRLVRHAGPRAPGASEVVRRLLAGPQGLSAREAEIAAGLILGRTQPQIASDMALSLGTVITYRRRAYGKLGVASRAELSRCYQATAAEGG